MLIIYFESPLSRECVATGSRLWLHAFAALAAFELARSSRFKKLRFVSLVPFFPPSLYDFNNVLLE